MREQLRVKVATADYLREISGKEAERRYIDGIMLINKYRARRDDTSPREKMITEQIERINKLAGIKAPKMMMDDSIKSLMVKIMGLDAGEE